VDFGLVLHHGKIRGREAQIPHDPFGHALVEGEGQNHGIGEGVGDIVGLEQSWHLRLASKAPQAFGDVEHQIPAFAGNEARGKGPNVPDALRLEAEVREGSLDGLNGIETVELGRLLLPVPLRQVIFPEIVGDPYFHGGALLPDSRPVDRLPRSRPAFPPCRPPRSSRGAGREDVGASYFKCYWSTIVEEVSSWRQASG
jgi:hypothetical protein